MKRFILFVAVVLLSLGISLPVFGAESGNGVIEGSIVNKTAGGGSVANVPITLKIYLNDAETGSSNTKTDADGKFTFKNLITTKSYGYQITLKYQGADYNGDRLTFGATETTKAAELAVYDSTTSDAAIKVTNAHTIISAVEGGIQVKEYYQFINESDRTYIGTGDGQDTRTLRFTVPKEATGLEYGLDFMQCCAVLSDGGVADSMAILPGPREMLFSYKINPSSGTYNLAQKMIYPVASYNLLVQSGVIQVSSDKLAPGQPIQIEGNRLNDYTTKNIAPGEVITAQLSNLPASSNPWSTVRWIALALVVLASVFGSFYVLKKRTKEQPQPVSVEGSFSRRKRRLLMELAELDENFENGKVEEGTYRQLRAAKKQQLVSLMQSMKR